MAKKITRSTKCMKKRCKKKTKHGKASKALQYCPQHWKDASKIRKQRNACGRINCKNPAHEDGFCDGCRPYSKKVVPFREDWLRGENLRKTNTFSHCMHCHVKLHGVESNSCTDCEDEILKILSILIQK